MAEFILWLESLSLASPDHVHVIGFSYGAHLAGSVGKEYRKLSGRKLSRVSGLDPAGPLYNIPPIFFKQAVSREDANFVDVYHTDAGEDGAIVPVAHIDFYGDKKDSL